MVTEIAVAKKVNFELLKGILSTKIEQPKTVIIASETHPKFDELLKTDTKIRNLYEGNWQSYGFKSRSEAEESLVTLLCMNGFSDDEIKEIMEGCKIGKWQEKDASYKDLTIEKGRKFAAEHVATDAEFSPFEPSWAQREKEEAKEYYQAPEIPPLAFALQNNIISNYIECMSKRTDGYTEYHYATILGILSRIIDRKIYVEFRQGRIFPNLWIILLGNSTTSRKTTCMYFGKDMVESPDFISESLIDDGEFFIPNDFTPESFIEILTGTPHGALWVDEAGSFLATAKKPYMSGVMDILCRIYDGKNYHRKLRTKKGKEPDDFFIKNPYISILFATTPERFSEYTTLIDLVSGFLVRFIYLFPQYRKKWMSFDEADESTADEIKKIEERLIRFYKTITNKEVQMTFVPDALEYYQRWQREKEENAEKTQDTIELAILGRLEIYAVKLAIIFTAAFNDFSLSSKITLAAIKEACRHIDTYFEPYSLEIIEMAKRDEQNNLQEKILAILRRLHGKTTQRILLQSIHRPLREVEEALDALVESGEIDIDLRQTKSKRTTKIIKLLCSSVAPVACDNTLKKEDNRGATQATQATTTTSTTFATLNQRDEDNKVIEVLGEGTCDKCGNWVKNRVFYNNDALCESCYEIAKGREAEKQECKEMPEKEDKLKKDKPARYVKREHNPKTPSEEKIKDLEERFKETHKYKNDVKCEDCERLGMVFVHLIKKGEKKLLCAACLEKEINKHLDMSVESVSADASPIGSN